MNFKVTVFVYGGGISRHPEAELLADARLRESVGIDFWTSGGIVLEQGHTRIVFDDDLGHLIESLLLEAPAALREGRDYGVDLRYDTGRIELTGAGEEVTVSLTDMEPLTAPRAEVIAALEEAGRLHAEVAALFPPPQD